MKVRNLAVVVLVLSFLGWCGSIFGQRIQPFEPSDRGSSSVPRGVPTDYFPFTTGLRLDYVVTLGKVEPLMSGIIDWPLGDGHAVTQLTRGRFVAAIDKKPGSTYALTLSILGPSMRQGPYLWYGVKVQVVKDELGIFQDVKELFWNRTSDMMFLEVRTYSSNSSGAPRGPWGTWGAGNGNSSRVVFFGGKPNTAISVGNGSGKESEEPKDMLVFLGSEGGKLHFVRKVKAYTRNRPDSRDRENGMLEQAFEEHTWFEYGRGMVRLEQRIGGVVSMTWVRTGDTSAGRTRF